MLDRGLCATAVLAVLAAVAMAPLVAGAQTVSSTALTVNTPFDGAVISGDLAFSGTVTPGDGIGVCTPSSGQFVLASAAIAGADGTFAGSVPAVFLPKLLLAGVGTFSVVFVDTGQGPIPATACGVSGVQSLTRTVSLAGSQPPATPLIIQTPTNGTLLDGGGVAFSGTATPGDIVVACAPSPQRVSSVAGSALVASDGTFSGAIPADLLNTQPGTFSIVFVDAGKPPVPSVICGTAVIASVGRTVVVPAVGGGTGGGDGGGVPNPGQTPELDSLVLFGGGIAGLAAYAMRHVRARRRE